jgi:hypothetical protein
MDVSRCEPLMTAGLDIGDKYSYLCLIDQQSGEVMEEGRLRTTPEAFRRRFASQEQPMRIAIEAGTHSRHGRAGYSRSAATRYLWPTPARLGSSTPTNARPTR